MGCLVPTSAAIYCLTLSSISLNRYIALGRTASSRRCLGGPGSLLLRAVFLAVSLLSANSQRPRGNSASMPQLTCRNIHVSPACSFWSDVARNRRIFNHQQSDINGYNWGHPSCLMEFFSINVKALNVVILENDVSG